MSVGPGDSDSVNESQQSAVVEPTDRLYVPHRKRMSFAYVTSDEGVRELCIYYGVKEVSFDEERLFAFGERLVQQSSFIAETATSWGGGPAGYAWSELRPLFEALVDAGIVQQGQPEDDPRGGGLVPSKLPPSVCPMHRSWSAADCEAITRDLAGRPVEIGNLEAILSVYRVAHPALDGDGRQVGEANVFPPALRLDLDTEWRVCQYPGSRYRDEAPMNVTALKAMIKHWKPMMATLLEVRRELAGRLERVRGGWTVGDLHLFAGVLLSLPGFQLMSGGPAAGSSPIHPVLSSLFRIADGIRMTTHLMLFLSAERTRSPEESTTATELFEFAERNGLLLADHGVCAGPRPMIDEFLNTVFSSEPAEVDHRAGLAPEVRSLLARLPDAVDYALLGLQSWSVTRSIWLAMSLAYRALRALLDEVDPAPTGIDGQLRARLARDWAKLNTARVAKDYERDVHLVVYTDTYEQSWRGLRVPQGAPTLAARLAPVAEGPAHARAAGALRELLATRLAGTPLGETAAVARIAALLVDYLREEQAILVATAQLQAEINTRLERAHPKRPLTARDLRVTYGLYGGSIATFPYLFDTLEDELGFHVTCDAQTIAIVDDRGVPPGDSGAEGRRGSIDDQGVPPGDSDPRRDAIAAVNA